MSSHPCNGSIWKTLSCYDEVDEQWRYGLCVGTDESKCDPTDPCTGMSRISNLIAPCGRQQDPLYTGLRYLTIEWEHRVSIASAPSFKNITWYSTSSSSPSPSSGSNVMVNVTLYPPNDNGMAYCAAFSQTPFINMAPAQLPSTSLEILAGGISGEIKNRSVSILLERLQSPSCHDIYCMTVSSAGDVMSDDKMLASKITACLQNPVILKVTAHSTFIKGVYDRTAIELAIENVLTYDLYVHIHARHNASNLPADLFDSNVVHFHPSSPTLQHSSYGNKDSLLVGFFDLQVLVSASANANEAENTAIDSSNVTVIINNGLFNVVGASDQLPPPTNMQALFDVTGTHILLVFNSPTDKAGLSSSVSFICSQLLNFVDNINSICDWKDDSTIRIN